MKLHHTQIQEFIADIIREYSASEEQYLNKELIAFAYANLLLEDPELVTDRHIRMLHKELCADQIIAITHCVLEHIGENAYVNAFRLRCSKILQEGLVEN